MKVAWAILLISALTDAMITAGTAYLAIGNDVPITNRVIWTIIIGGSIAGFRTIQQALKTTPETAAALKGEVTRSETTMTAETTAVSKTP